MRFKSRLDKIEQLLGIDENSPINLTEVFTWILNHKENEPPPPYVIKAFEVISEIKVSHKRIKGAE